MTEPIFFDLIALRNTKESKKKSFKKYALQHKETKLYFHKRIQRSWNGEFDYYASPIPMFRASPSAFSYWLKHFWAPADWEIVTFEFEKE